MIYAYLLLKTIISVFIKSFEKIKYVLKVNIIVKAKDFVISL